MIVYIIIGGIIMIDLHTHTKYSDGTFSVKELLTEAEKTGVTLLSITDHDKLSAHIEMQDFNVKEYYTGKIIVGTEFSASHEGKRIELLGYGFDISKVKPWLDKMYNREKMNQDNIMEFKEIYQICKEKGLKVTENLEYIPTDYPVDVVYYDIKKYEENKKFFTDEEWNNIDVFWRKCSNNKDFILYWDFTKRIPSSKEVSELIRNAGGKVFVAHIFKYQVDDHIEMLDSLVNNDIIDGVEVYYSAFNDEQIKFLENYCKKRNLYMSAGSDFHGMKKKDRKIGIGYGNMNVQEDVVQNWIKEI